MELKTSRRLPSYVDNFFNKGASISSFILIFTFNVYMYTFDCNM